MERLRRIAIKTAWQRKMGELKAASAIMARYPNLRPLHMLFCAHQLRTCVVQRMSTASDKELSDAGALFEDVELPVDLQQPDESAFPEGPAQLIYYVPLFRLKEINLFVITCTPLLKLNLRLQYSYVCSLLSSISED